MKSLIGRSFVAYYDPEGVSYDYSFTDGVIDTKFVKCRYMSKDTNKWENIPLESHNIGLTSITLDALPPCTILEIYRDTEKASPLVSYGNGGSIVTNQSRNAAARQSMHILVELVELANRQVLEEVIG